MPEDEVGASETTLGQGGQPESAVDASAAAQPESKPGVNGQRLESSEGEKKPLKVPENLKPKSHGDGKEPAWVQGRLSHYAQQLKETREELARLKSGDGVSRGTQPKPSNAPDGAPNPDDYTLYQDYIDAFIDYKVTQREQAAQRQQSEASTQQYREQKRAEFNQHATSIVEQVPQFWDVVSDPSLPVSEAMAESVMELGELAPYTMLWLASNRQEALRISRLQPHAASVEIGRLAVQLERELTGGGGNPEPAEPAQPQFTPKPVPQIRGNAPGNIDQGPSEKDDTATWMRKEAERQRRKFGNPNLRVYMPR